MPFIVNVVTYGPILPSQGCCLVIGISCEVVGSVGVLLCLLLLDDGALCGSSCKRGLIIMTKVPTPQVQYLLSVLSSVFTRRLTIVIAWEAGSGWVIAYRTIIYCHTAIFTVHPYTADLSRDLLCVSGVWWGWKDIDT